MPQNPTRQVHAVLGGFVQDTLTAKEPARKKIDKIIARNFDFGNNQKTGTYKHAGVSKTKHKLTRTLILENLVKPKENIANESDKILQTQLN